MTDLYKIALGAQIKIGVNSGRFCSITVSTRKTNPIVNVIGHNRDRILDGGIGSVCLGWNNRIMGITGHRPSESWGSSFIMTPDYMDYMRSIWIDSSLIVEAVSAVYIPNQKCSGCGASAPHKKVARGKYTCEICKVLAVL